MSEIFLSNPGVVLSFDGQVFEAFGPYGGDAKRWHVRWLHANVEEPDRKGLRHVRFNGNDPGVRYPFGPEQLAEVEAFVAEIKAAQATRQ